MRIAGGGRTGLMAHALDADGARTGATLAVHRDGDGWSLPIAGGGCLWWELVFAPAPAGTQGTAPQAWRRRWCWRKMRLK